MAGVCSSATTVCPGARGVRYRRRCVRRRLAPGDSSGSSGTRFLSLSGWHDVSISVCDTFSVDDWVGGKGVSIRGGWPRILWAIVRNVDEWSGFVCRSALFSLPYILRASIWLFDVVEHHEEMFAFLSVAGFRFSEGYAVVFHDDGREF